MILVFNWKKTRRLLLSALLFCVFAAIIVAVKDFENITAVSESSAVHSPDKILIIDPGHGGADGGAVSSDGITESSINLSMSQKLEEIAALFGVKTLMTRNSEDLDYPESAGTIRDKKIWDQKRRV